MLHKTRRFVVVDIASAEELAHKLTQYTWCGCNGFRLGKLLFLNDSTSPDGAGEYAVVRQGRQIESITFSWCDEPQALEYIRRLQAGTLGADYGAVTNLVESPAEHGTCHLCA